MVHDPVGLIDARYAPHRRGVDPFGNILGVMYNPHYLEVLGSTEPA